MGYGAYNTNTHQARSAAKKAAGQDIFTYSASTYKTPRSSWRSHDSLDPKLKAGDKSAHAGQVMRECIISDDHPDPTPIAVLFDVTGSMGSIPRTLQTKMGALHGLLVRKGYASDPQILFGAIGDANTDRVPLQVGQFESDNAMDENLENIFLEGNGGGQGMESYALGAYFLARHTYLDPFEKNGKKGYAFLIGDERYYNNVPRAHIQDLIGDTIAANVGTEEIFRELEKRYHVYFIAVESPSYYFDYNLGKIGDTFQDSTWRGLLGERAIPLEDPNAVCETIAGVIGILEGAVTLDDTLDDLADVGADPKAIQAAGRALATVGAGANVVAGVSGSLPGLDD